MIRNYDLPQTCPYCNTAFPCWNKEYTDHLVYAHPISCEEVRSKFPDYSFGKLDDETDERIIQHISGCKECDAKLSEYINGKIKEHLAAHLG